MIVTGTPVMPATIEEIFAEAARTITLEDCMFAVHRRALTYIVGWGFSPLHVKGSSVDAVRRTNDSLRTILEPIRWEGAEGNPREIHPELVTQSQVKADQGMKYQAFGWPESFGASLLQMEIIRGFDRILTVHSVYHLFDEDYAYQGRGDGRWIREFKSDGTKVIRIPIQKGKFTDGGLVYAELHFWNGFPHSASAKPV